VIDYADHNAGVLSTAPGQWNPYKVGITLLRHIEERWDKGRFGKEWNECEDYEARRTWDKRLGLGKQKIFEVRRLYNDVTFLDEFFTEDFCREHQFFSFSLNERSGNYEIDSREFQKVKQKILFQLTNFGEPFIFVEDANHDNRAELLLRHRHEGTDLHEENARATLAALERIWRRPVNLITNLDGKNKCLRYDGKDHSEKAA
jgi:stage V sporulation protein R